MVPCPSCGEPNPTEARFCWACGARMTRNAAVPAEERKVVTVLFCELVGFNELADHADPEEIRATLRLYHARIRQEIDTFGGTLDKFVGDAALGVFGAPVAHEDDPERAVRAGLAIQGAIGALQRAGEPLSVRVGIATGEAVVAFGAGPQIGESVTGDMVNTASRIQSIASPGTIAVSEETYRATRDCFEYESLGPVAVKGKAAPIQIWRAIAPTSSVALGREVRERGATPFVGRTEELAVLQAVYRRMLRGSVQLVTVSGEPGVGKSRLIEEFRAWADSAASPAIPTWRQGRCLPYGEGVTFWALGEIVKAEAGVLESDSADVAAAKLRTAVAGAIADPMEAAWFGSRLAPLVGVGRAVGADRAESFAAWRGFLQAVASRGPLVLLFEDLHWADPALLHFVEDLSSRVSDLPLLVLVATRPDLFDRHAGWSRELSNATQVVLSPLSDDDTARLVRALLRRTVLPPDTEALLLDRAGGNPLYAEEFVRMLTDRGLVDAGGELVGDLLELEFPRTVQALIASRLDALPFDQKALLQGASVMGRVFWTGAVARLSGVEEGAVESAMEALARREIVRVSPTSSVEGQREFSFWHLLLRDVAYAQLPRSIRARMHRAAAEWIERVAGERAADHAEVLAHHAMQALELTRAAGEIEAMRPLEDAARRYLLLAGRRALALDVTRAQAHLQLALELTPEGQPDRAPALTALAHAEFQAGRMEEAQRLFEAAVAEFGDRDRPVERADSMVGLFRVLQYRGFPTEARAMLSEATRILENEPPGPELLRALAETVGMLMTSGRHAEAVEQSARALALARQVGEPEQEVRVLDFRGFSKIGLGDPSGLDEERRALDRALELGLGRTAAVAYNNLATDLRIVESPSAAIACFREGIEFSESRGIEEMAAWMRMTALLPLIDLGAWDEVLAASQDVIHMSRARGAGYDEAFAEGLRAVVLAHRGRAQESALERSLGQARAIGDPQVVVNALAAGGVARLGWGDGEGAAALVEEALDATSAAGADIRAWNLPDLVRVAIGSGRTSLARRLLEGIHDSLVRYRLAMESARAAIAEAEDDQGEAEGRYRVAAEAWGAYGHLMERGLSLVGRGRCLVRLRRSNHAGPALREGREILARLAAQPHVLDADAWLDRIDQREP